MPLDLEGFNEYAHVNPSPDQDIVDRLRFDDSLEVPWQLTDVDLWNNYCDDRIYELDKRIRAYLKGTRYTREKKGKFKTAAPLVFLHLFGRRADGDAAFLGRFLRGAGQQAAQRFTREFVALRRREHAVRDGGIEDFGQDAIGGHDRHDLAHDAGGARHDHGDDFLVLAVEEIVGRGDPDAEEVDQLAVEEAAGGGDVHQVVDGLEQGGEDVLAPAEVGLGEGAGPDSVFRGGFVRGGQKGRQAGVQLPDAFLLFAESGAGDAAGRE